jgi:hypothetical protein
MRCIDEGETGEVVGWPIVGAWWGLMTDGSGDATHDSVRMDMTQSVSYAALFLTVSKGCVYDGEAGREEGDERVIRGLGVEPSRVWRGRW